MPGWSGEAQGGEWNRGAQHRGGDGLPRNEARAAGGAGPEQRGLPLPLLPMPIFAQPEQYQSKEYVTAARAPTGSSKAKARTIVRLTTSLEYVLDLADDVSSRDKSPGSAVAAVVAVITQDEVVAIGYPARQAFRGLGTLLAERKRFRRRHDGRRFRLDEDQVLLVAESFQILNGGIRAVLANGNTDLPD